MTDSAPEEKDTTPKTIAAIAFATLVVSFAFFVLLGFVSVSKSTDSYGQWALAFSGFLPAVLAVAVGSLVVFLSVRVLKALAPSEVRQLPGAIYAFLVATMISWSLTRMGVLFGSLEHLYPESSSFPDARSLYVASFPTFSLSAFGGSLFSSVGIALFASTPFRSWHSLIALFLGGYGLWELVRIALAIT